MPPIDPDPSRRPGVPGRAAALWREARRHAREALRGWLARAGPELRRAASRAAQGARALVWPPTPERWAALLALAVGGLGLQALAFQARLSARLPAPLDWRAAAALLERDARPGDAVAIDPSWAERARVALPDRVAATPEAPLPVLAFPRYAAALEDLAGLRRIWLVSLPEAPGFREAVSADLAARAESVDGPQRLGALEMTRYDLRSPVLPLAFLPGRLATARVALGGEPCPDDGTGAIRCPGGVRLSRQVRQVGDQPRNCLLVEGPIAPTAPLEVEFPAVPLGRALRGHAGPVGAPEGPFSTRIGVGLAGEPLGAVDLAPGPPWQPFQLDTTIHAGRSGDLALSLVAAEGTRPLCLEAMTLP